MKTSQVNVLTLIALLCVAVYSFYLAAATDWVSRDVYMDNVDMRRAHWSFNYGFGTVYDWPVKPYGLLLQPRERIEATCYPTNGLGYNGTVFLIIWDETNASTLDYSSYDYISFTDTQIAHRIKVVLATTNQANELTTEVLVSRLSKPNWLWFAAGVTMTAASFVLSWATRNSKPKVQS